VIAFYDEAYWTMTPCVDFEELCVIASMLFVAGIKCHPRAGVIGQLAHEFIVMKGL
jgi:hypothetical protein